MVVGGGGEIEKPFFRHLPRQVTFFLVASSPILVVRPFLESGPELQRRRSGDCNIAGPLAVNRWRSAAAYNILEPRSVELLAAGVERAIPRQGSPEKCCDRRPVAYNI